MSARFLLDTNIISDLVRHPQGRVARHVAKVGDDRVCTSVIVTSELRYGVAKKASPKLRTQLDLVLGVLEVLPFEPPADAIYGDLRVDLEKRGQPIGGNDLLIAAQALAFGYTLVTDNEDEFARVPRLTIANWIRA